MAVQKLTRTHYKNSSKKFNIHLKLLEQVVVLTLNFTSVQNILLVHLPDGLYEAESNENLKSVIKIRNAARLSCKLATVILMV